MVDSITDSWLKKLWDSIIKSFLDPVTPNWCGKVFLTKSDEFISKVWSLSSNWFNDLNLLPTKYGNFGVNVPSVVIPAKYA